MDQMILRAIQQEVRRIECKLDNPRTGLAEIKAAVAAIESAIRSLGVPQILNKLNALAHEIQEVEGAVDDVEDKLDDPSFGLEEIKEDIEGIEHTLAELSIAPVLAALNEVKHEVEEIEHKLDDPHVGLEEIQEGVAGIEGMLEHPETGLAQLKHEIEEIEAKIDNLNTQQLLALLAAIKAIALIIEQKLDDPHCGLQEIKNAVAAIDGKLDSPHCGLHHIKSEVSEIVSTLHHLDLQQLLALLGAIEAEVMEIEAKLDSHHFGLQEIKSVVTAIEAKLDNPHHVHHDAMAEIQGIPEQQEGQSATLTSGPVFLTDGAHSVIVTVHNNAAATQAVTIHGFEIEPTVAPLTGSPTAVTLDAGQATTVKFGFPLGTLAYEIRVLFSIPGSVGAFSAARTQDENADLAASTLLPENTVRNEEFKPPFVPGP